MKISLLLYFALLTVTFTSYAQDSSIVSLSIGNKWYYHYHKSSTNGTTDRLEIKEVAGDTTISGKAYKKIFVISVGSDTTTWMEFWGVDSLKLFFKNVELLGWPLDTFYDISIQSDTVFWYHPEFPVEEYGVYIDTFELWGDTKYTQKWYYYADYFASYYSNYVQTVLGIGPVEIHFYSTNEFETIDKTSTLIGALLDGVLYGDTIVVSVPDENKILPSNFVLYQNYPNPFNPSTTIKYQLPEMSFVTIKVYNVLGKEIATLINEEKPAGNYKIEFDGSGLTSGIYFYQLRARDFVETKKMVLLR